MLLSFSVFVQRAQNASLFIPFENTIISCGMRERAPDDTESSNFISTPLLLLFFHLLNANSETKQEEKKRRK